MKRVKISPYTRAYIEKTEAFVAGRDPYKLLAAAPPKFAKAVAGLTDAQLNQRPSPKKWSIKEIMGHVADSEMIYGYRYRLAMCEPGSPIVGYDQDVWSNGLRYRRMPVVPMLLKYHVLRADNLAMIRSATPQQRKNYGVHTERGNESVERIAFLLAGHDLNHLSQILAIRKQFGWTGKPVRKAAKKRGAARKK